MGCGCKKRRPPVRKVQNIKLTKDTKPTPPPEKKTISEAEQQIINQIASELRASVAVV